MISPPSNQRRKSEHSTAANIHLDDEDEKFFKGVIEDEESSSEDKEEDSSSEEDEGDESEDDDENKEESDSDDNSTIGQIFKEIKQGTFDPSQKRRRFGTKRRDFWKGRKVFGPDSKEDKEEKGMEYTELLPIAGYQRQA